MSSKPKFFSWSKGRQTVEPYHRTGGLLSIDTSVGDWSKEAYVASNTLTVPGAGRRRPPLLNLTIPREGHHHPVCLSPASARHNAALVNSASNLLAVVNDMLRSPGLSATVCSRSTAEIHKPLPSRPRSVSMPSTPELPIELPGSILLENQGFPIQPAAPFATPGPSTMRPARSGYASSSSATPLKPSPSRVPQHKKSFSEASLQRRSRSKPNLITSPSSTDSKITACSVSTNGGHASSNESTKARVGAERSSLQPSPLIIEGKPASSHNNGKRTHANVEEQTPDTPTPTTTRSRRIEELKSTITAQDNTISTLQAQFGSLRASHEAHVASLIDAHAAEIASLKNYTRVLEEQQSQRTLHHASSNHLLLFLDSATPQTPTRESPQTATADSASATSVRSFKTALEQPTRSPQVARDSPEMDNLKRKLSAARRPETGNRELIRELNLYKHNNAALQKQIESLMAKLNQAKTNERNLTATLEEIERNCTEWQAKASRVEQLEKSALALQNTIDHLEHRLEMANTEKIDAEEHLLNLQTGRSPFDPKPPKLNIPDAGSRQADRQNAHMSISTVFSSGSPTGHVAEPQDASTLAAFVSRIERLQEQVKEKESAIEQLKEENLQLRHKSDRLEHDRRELNLQLEIQNQLLDKSKIADVHINELRSAIIQRESIIGEKEKALRMAERQLEHHKLLLHADIRKHATLALVADNQNNPLPELSSLASKEDIDRWIERLRARLQKERKDPKHDKENRPRNGTESLVRDLRQEIDFYVREIIYYKLDIKGYKSDIKKLKHIATRMGSYGSRASDVDSPTPSQSRAPDTPNPARLSTATSGLGISTTTSPVSTGPISVSLPVGRPITPIASLPTPDRSPEDSGIPTFGIAGRTLCETVPMTPQTPPRKPKGASDADPGVSPRSVARLSPERRKPTPPSPDQEKFGDMATNFPLSTPAAPKRHDTQRSMSDSIIQLYTMPRTPEWSPFSNPEKPQNKVELPARQRSASVPDTSKGKTTPERPPRPRYGLYETAPTPPSPPCVDVMAQAMRNSPDRAKAQEQSAQYPNRVLSDATVSHLRGLSNSQLSRTDSTGSGAASNIPAPLNLPSRAGSAGSSTRGIPQPTSPSRKFSTGSGNNIPFIIGMPSPHNPALISPITTVPPTACSITGKCTTASSSKVQSPTSRTGVGGTMASSTPATSPIDPPTSVKTSFFNSSFPLPKPSISRAGSTTHTPNASLSMPSRKDSDAGVKATGHSRNLSGSSFRSALNSQLPGLMKGKGKARKESLSISQPRPLESPFGVEVGEGVGEVEVGRAI